MLIGIDASRAQLNSKTGTENYSVNLIKALAEIDKENRYLLYLRNELLYPIVAQPNFTSKVLHAPYLWTQYRLALECLLNPPDVLFIPAHTLPIIRRSNLKSVVTIHDLGEEFLPGYHQFPQKYYLSFASRYAADNASRLIAVSESTKKDLKNRYHVPESKVSVIHEGIDTTFFTKSSVDQIKIARSKYALNRKYLFFLGTIQPRKNLERLISAFARNVHSGVAKDIDLVIAGGKGWLDKDIYATPVKEAVSDNVKFVGYVPDEDLPPLYSDALAFVYPSLFEGFGLPILEAFACGTPVLSSNTTSIPEVAGEAAILVNPENIDEIELGLKELITNSSKRIELIKKGSIQVKKFTWQKAASETLKVLTEVVGRG